MSKARKSSSLCGASGLGPPEKLWFLRKEEGREKVQFAGLGNYFRSNDKNVPWKFGPISGQLICASSSILPLNNALCHSQHKLMF